MTSPTDWPWPSWGAQAGEQDRHEPNPPTTSSRGNLQAGVRGEAVEGGAGSRGAWGVTPSDPLFLGGLDRAGVCVEGGVFSLEKNAIIPPRHVLSGTRFAHVDSDSVTYRYDNATEEFRADVDAVGTLTCPFLSRPASTCGGLRECQAVLGLLSHPSCAGNKTVELHVPPGNAAQLAAAGGAFRVPPHGRGWGWGPGRCDGGILLP